MPISLGGLASGIDTGSLVDGLMSVAQQPVNELTKRKAAVDSASQTVSALATKLSALKSAALALSTTVGFASFAASSSDPAVVATASGAASVASYSVQVDTLARPQKSRSGTFASSNTALDMAGSLDIAVGTGAAKSVNIVNTDTLSDIAAKISASGARVSASVMSDGKDFRLIVQGLDSGKANGFTIGENSTNLKFGDAGNLYEDARDATIYVDTMKVTSPTNQITGVIAGVKLALTKTTTSAATVQVTTDATALKSKVTTFVSAYNDFINNGHVAAGFGGAKAPNAVLAADSSIRTALHKVGALVSGVVAGTSGKYRSMGSVGVKLGRDGTLSFDGSAFDTAITADPESVRRLFITDTATGATGLMKTLMTAIDGLLTGKGAAIQSRIDGLSAQSQRLDDSANKMQSRLADYKLQLQKQFTNMDQLIAKYKTMNSALDSSILGNTSGNGNGSNG